jgi:hypothetical protein
MTQIINGLSNFSYDSGIVSFSLINGKPGANGQAIEERIADVCIRLDDLKHIVEFLSEQIVIVEPINSDWLRSRLGLAAVATEATVSTGDSQARPPIGRRVGR